MAEKIDLKKQWKDFYRPSTREPVIVDIPKANYLMIDGSGNPNTAKRFQDAIQTLYPLAYALKFAVRNQHQVDYGVMPLEGLYWGTPQGQTHFTDADKEQWFWTLMILQPDWVDQSLLSAVMPVVKRKKKPALIDEVRFERFEEGRCVTIRHIGPFDQEGPNVERMHAYAAAQGYELHGKHHEIYLNDFTRTAPEKLETVLRHPIARSSHAN